MLSTDLGKTVFSITDDSGFIGLVNVDKYDSFLEEDWEFEQLQERFVEQMNKNCLLIWSTGHEGEWQVIFFDHPTEQDAFRELESVIEITNGSLFLTNFEDLTMAAQFDDVTLPLEHNSNLFIQLENGFYRVVVRQMFNPYQLNEMEKLRFEIVLNPVDKLANHHNKIHEVFWSKQ